MRISPADVPGAVVGALYASIVVTWIAGCVIAAVCEGVRRLRLKDKTEIKTKVGSANSIG